MTYKSLSLFILFNRGFINLWSRQENHLAILIKSKKYPFKTEHISFLQIEL